MSIYVVGKVQLNIDLSNEVQKKLFEEALMEVANKIGGKLVKNATVYGYSFKRKVPYLIMTNLRYGNGYGIEIKNGEIIVHADVHGAKYMSVDVAKMIAQAYTTKAILRVAQKLKKKVQLKRVENKNVVYVYEV